MPPITLSIVIANYNEMANLKAGALTKVAVYLKKAPFTWEVIISDDGSTDGSLKFLTDFVAKHSGFQLLTNPHQGKAGALKSGILKAKGKYILYTDMDQSTPLSQVEKLLPYLKDFKVVIGSRGKSRDSSLFRQILSFSFLTFRRFLILPDIIDTQCGFKAFEAKLLKDIFPRLSNFTDRSQAIGWKVSAFDVELLFLAAKRGEKIKEVKVNWRDEDLSKDKGRNFVKESIDMLKQVVKVTAKDILGQYALKKN